MYSLESPHRGDSNEYIQHIIIVYKIEKISLSYRHRLPDLKQWLTLSGSNYPYLEQISMVRKRFDCRIIRDKHIQTQFKMCTQIIQEYAVQDWMCTQRRRRSARVRSRGTRWVAKDPKRLQADRDDWSACADQSDLLVHMQYCRECYAPPQMI